MSTLIAFLFSTLIISAVAQECTQGSVRLQSRFFSRRGRVEVCNAGRWGTVCDDFFTDTAASVVCGQLGFSNRGARHFTSTRIFFRGSTRQPIFLDDVNCNGTEDSIFDCNARPIGSHNCRHSEDVSVSCRAASFGDIRLRGRQTPRSGRVEVFDGTVWGTVCDDYWSRNDALVACRQLFPTATIRNARALRLGAGYMQLPNTSPAPIVLDNLLCTGSETSLANCSHNGIGVHNCRHNEDAGVQCDLVETISSQEIDKDEKMEDEIDKQAIAENSEVKGEGMDEGMEKQVDEESDSEDPSMNLNMLVNVLEDLMEE